MIEQAQIQDALQDLQLGSLYLKDLLKKFPVLDL